MEFCFLQLTRELNSSTNTVRFIWFSSSAFSHFGATHYVSTLHPSDLASIAGFLSLSSIASKNYIYGIYHPPPTASPGTTISAGGIEEFLQTYFKTLVSKPYIPLPAGLDNGDFTAFAEAGIPWGALTSGTRQVKTEEWSKLFGGWAGKELDWNDGGKGDLLAEMNTGAWIENTKAAAHWVAEMAR